MKEIKFCNNSKLTRIGGFRNNSVAVVTAPSATFLYKNEGDRFKVIGLKSLCFGGLLYKNNME